jgi:hypothetical protein
VSGCYDKATHVSSIGGHHGEIVLVDDLLHLLHASEVSKHVSDRDNVAILDELLSDLFRRLDRSSSDRLKSAKIVSADLPSR